LGHQGEEGEDKYTFNYDAMRTENAGKQMKNVSRMPPPSKDEKGYGKHPTQKP
jgi:site-specific DNA-methyltransferase (adenine-specific)